MIWSLSSGNSTMPIVLFSCSVLVQAIEDAELRRLDPATALAQTEMLLSAVRLDDLSEERRTSSGFVEQQRLFARARR